MSSASAAHHWTAASLQAFAQLLHLTGAAPKNLGDQLNVVDLSDELGRLRVWAANIGALQKGHSSLDYRLREAPLVHENILKLLNELVSSLREMSLVLSGTRLPYELEPRPNFDENRSDISSSSSSTSDSSLISDESFDEAPSSELQQRFTSLIDIIDNLYKLSRTIRMPSIQTRILKAASFKKIDKETGIDLIEQFSTFDLCHTAELFRHLREDAREEGDGVIRPDDDRVLCSDDNLLVRRLSSAITQRRQQFMYWRRHREKLGVSVINDDFRLPTSTQQQESNEIDHEPVQATHQPLPVIDKEHSQINTKINGKSVAGRTALTTTTATVFLSAENISDTRQSTTSFATTALGLDGKRIAFPSLPASIRSMRDFECPYCFTICPSKYQTPRAWRAHLLRDLRPYVCTYLQCDSANQLFGSRFDWLEHERAYHRKAWLCPEHTEEHYHSLDEFDYHLRTKDHIVLSKMSLVESIAVSETSDPDPRRVCTICLRSFLSAEDLHSHLANHLERFAAFAFPRDVESSDDEDLSVDGSGIKSIRADARSIESEDLGAFKIYTLEDLKIELEFVNKLLNSLIQISASRQADPSMPSNAYFPTIRSLEIISTKFESLGELLDADGLSPFVEDVTGLILRFQNTFRGFLASPIESDADNGEELAEQLKVQHSELTKTLMRDYKYFTDSIENGTALADPLLIIGPQDGDPAIQDKAAKDEFISAMTGISSGHGRFTIYLSWYINFVESKMRFTWTYLFEPTLSGLSHKSIEPQKGDFAVAYRFLTRVALVLQQSPKSIMLRKIIDDHSIRNLWNLRHPKAFWDLTFCAVGWLTLLYEPSLIPEFENLQLAPSQKFVAATMWSQLSVPLGALLTSMSDDVSTQYSARSTTPLTSAPQEFWFMMFRAGLKPVLTDSMMSHLKIDKANRTVSLFRFPSFCAMLYSASNRNQAGVVTGLCTEILRQLPGYMMDPFIEVENICREILVSYYQLHMHRAYKDEMFSHFLAGAANSIPSLWNEDGQDPMFEALFSLISPAGMARGFFDDLGFVSDHANTWTDLYFLQRRFSEFDSAFNLDGSGHPNVEEAERSLPADFDDQSEFPPLPSSHESSIANSQDSVDSLMVPKIVKPHLASEINVASVVGFRPHLQSTSYNAESGSDLIDVKSNDSKEVPKVDTRTDFSRVPSSQGSSERESLGSETWGGSVEGASSGRMQGGREAKKKSRTRTGLLQRGREIVSNIFGGGSAR